MSSVTIRKVWEAFTDPKPVCAVSVQRGPGVAPPISSLLLRGGGGGPARLGACGGFVPLRAHCQEAAKGDLPPKYSHPPRTSERELLCIKGVGGRDERKGLRRRQDRGTQAASDPGPSHRLRPPTPASASCTCSTPSSSDQGIETPTRAAAKHQRGKEEKVDIPGSLFLALDLRPQVSPTGFLYRVFLRLRGPSSATWGSPRPAEPCSPAEGTAVGQVCAGDTADHVLKNGVPFWKPRARPLSSRAVRPGVPGDVGSVPSCTRKNSGIPVPCGGKRRQAPVGPRPTAELCMGAGLQAVVGRTESPLGVVLCAGSGNVPESSLGDGQASREGPCPHGTPPLHRAWTLDSGKQHFRPSCPAPSSLGGGGKQDFLHPPSLGTL